LYRWLELGKKQWKRKRKKKEQYKAKSQAVPRPHPPLAASRPPPPSSDPPLLVRKGHRNLLPVSGEHVLIAGLLVRPVLYISVQTKKKWIRECWNGKKKEKTNETQHEQKQAHGFCPYRKNKKKESGRKISL
jgi:hypothetical protein